MIQRPFLHEDEASLLEKAGFYSSLASLARSRVRRT